MLIYAMLIYDMLIYAMIIYDMLIYAMLFLCYANHFHRACSDLATHAQASMHLFTALFPILYIFRCFVPDAH